ncbi:MAG TPA: hypothetical protein VJ436_10660, partial [Anaerolineales bacterium]|nr:hypothetical protein [Anaerolineales bacterium]
MRPYHVLIVLLYLGLNACAERPVTPTGEVPSSAWIGHASMPTPRSEMPAVELEGLIYAPGGFGGESQFEAYDPRQDAWQALAQMPEPRQHLMAAAHSRRVYIFGGGKSVLNWAPSTQAWAYDPGLDRWV